MSKIIQIKGIEGTAVIDFNSQSSGPDDVNYNWGAVKFDNADERDYYVGMPGLAGHKLTFPIANTLLGTKINHDLKDAEAIHFYDSSDERQFGFVNTRTRPKPGPYIGGKGGTTPNPPFGGDDGPLIGSTGNSLGNKLRIPRVKVDCKKLAEEHKAYFKVRGMRWRKKFPIMCEVKYETPTSDPKFLLVNGYKGQRFKFDLVIYRKNIGKARYDAVAVNLEPIN